MISNFLFSGHELACCLWGSYAERIEEHLEKANGDDIVCLIRFAKISEFQGMNSPYK